MEVNHFRKSNPPTIAKMSKRLKTWHSKKRNFENTSVKKRQKCCKSMHQQLTQTNYRIFNHPTTYWKTKTARKFIRLKSNKKNEVQSRRRRTSNALRLHADKPPGGVSVGRIQQKNKFSQRSLCECVRRTIWINNDVKGLFTQLYPWYCLRYSS